MSTFATAHHAIRRSHPPTLRARGRARHRPLTVRALVACLFAGAIAVSPTLAAVANPVSAGPQPDGTAVTPEGWRLTPAGTQTTLGADPLAAAMSPAGDVLLVVNAGYQQHSLMAIDPATGHVRQTFSEEGGNSSGPWGISNGHSNGYYLGLAFAPDGKTAWASNGPGSALHAFTVASGRLTELQPIKLADNKGNATTYPAGIAVSHDGKSLFVAGNLADELLVVDPVKRTVRATIPVGHLPYGVALNRSGTRAFVTNWGEDSVTVVNTASAKAVTAVTVGTHPSAIQASPNRDELYVADSDSSEVSVLSSTTGAVLRTIDLRPSAGAPVGSSPDAIAVSRDGRTLYVAEAGSDDVAVVTLAPDGATRGDTVAGRIPTAWYPSAVALAGDGKTVFVANMKGMGVGATEAGTYWPTLMRGTLSRIAVPTASQLAVDTLRVAANNRVQDGPATPAAPGRTTTSGLPAGITHVIYVMKENRTYDQILGDLEKGNGDPSLAIFGQDVSPNHHQLARRFVTFDNFHADAEVSADGWSWATGAYANSFIAKNWPLDYNGYGYPYNFGGFGVDEQAGLPGEEPGKGFIWDAMARSGVDYRNFGLFVDNPVDLVESMPGLLDHTDPDYPGWDLKVPDQVRMDHWLKVFSGYVAARRMPSMQFVYLPSDHTYGTTQSARRPTAYVADNDLALGRLVEAVSHSSFWASTAIFVVEDDAQDGPDHVDAHRSIAFAISPYTRTGAVDSHFYSSVSVLRTMELIFGVPPLSQFDAASTPMTAAFSSHPDLTPYTALQPKVSLWATNQAGDPMTAESGAIDFSEPDRIPMDLMNRIIWQSVRGTGSTWQLPSTPQPSATPQPATTGTVGQPEDD